MIIAWALLIIFGIFTLSGLIGIVKEEYDTTTYLGVFMVSLALLSLPAQYIWG